MPHLVFIKKQDESNPYDTVAVKMSSDAESLTDILDNFRLFLQACGFVIGKDQELILMGELKLKDEHDDT